MKYKVIILCLFDVVYTVAKGLNELEACDLAAHVWDMLDDSCYDDLMVKQVKVVPM